MLVLFGGGIAAACVLGSWLLTSAELLPQPSHACWTCSETILLLAGLTVLTVGQLMTVTLLPVILLPRLLVKARLPCIFWISVVASMVNAFAPAKAGIGVKAIAFKRMLDVGYLDFAGSHLAASAISLIACIGIILLTYGGELVGLGVAVINALATNSIWIALIAMAAVGAAMMMWRMARANIRRALGSTTRVLMDRRFAARLPGMFIVAVLQLTLMGASAILASYIFGARPAWSTVLVFGAVLALAPLISFLPGGVGTRESIFVLAGSISGIPIPVAVAAALVDRLVGTTVVTVLGVVGLRALRSAPHGADDSNS